MRRMLLPLLAAAALAAPSALHAQAAQSPSDPVVAAAKQMVQRYARNLVAAAQEMPAEKYDYKPTEAQMTYGALMAHVAGSNDFLCNALSGEKGAGEMGKPAGKDATVTALQKSFEHCEAALGTLTDSELGEMVPWFGGRQVTKATALLGLTGDLMDHYATASNYLRLNGMLPPTARKR